MSRNFIYCLVLFAPLFSTKAQDFGKVYVATGVGFTIPLGELASRDFNKPGGVADQGFKIDLVTAGYQFKNGFGLGSKLQLLFTLLTTSELKST